MRRYVLNLLIAVDQSWNAALGGNPDETISSRVGKAYLHGKRWAALARAAIDWLFRMLDGQQNHCVASIEWDEA